MQTASAPASPGLQAAVRVSLRYRKTAWVILAKQGWVTRRFHDLRHQAITELAEAGEPDRVIESLAGHLSRKMLEHYSHVRKAAKRKVISKLPGGLMAAPSLAADAPADKPI